MSIQEDVLNTGESFPADIALPSRAELLQELAAYGVQGAGAIRLVDSTRDETDVRLNYIIGRRWVLRYCNRGSMTERRMADLNRLIERYRRAGILCPAFLPDAAGNYLHARGPLECYLSEYINLRLANEAEGIDAERLLFQVQASVASFAEANRNADLSDTMGMYSLFDLSPFDLPVGYDEKQDNFNHLLELLHRKREDELAARLEARHSLVRQNLRAVYRSLPRCVFQADENFSNVLIDAKGDFAGFIDFNLAGTEVVVNQLVNLVGFDYDEKTESPIGAEARLEHAIRGFQEHMRPMLRLYHAGEPEKQALAWYAWIVMVAQWPIFCYFRHAIEKGELKAEICELLSLIADLPEDRLRVGE